MKSNNVFFLFLLLVLSYGVDLRAQDNVENTKKRAVSMRGGISVGGFFYKTNRKKSFLQPYGYAMNMNLNTSIYGVQIPMHFSLNQQGSSLKTPFNRFGISPKYKWITLHIGHRNYNWSEFLMAGATVYGIGLELDVQEYKLGAVIGLLRQAQIAGTTNYGVPQFARSVEAFRIGKQSKYHHFYFTLLRGKDDLKSLSNTPKDVISSVEANENNAFDIDLKLPFKEDIVYMTFEMAFSSYTENIRHPNIPLDSFPKIQFLERIMDLKPSTNISSAFKGGIHFNYDNFKISGEARSVKPGFKTFGTNYMLSDITTITIVPSLSFWKKKAIISGSYGQLYNNLDERLTQRTNRQIGSVQLNVNPNSRLGLFAQYSNYTLYQQVIKDSLANDSILIDQINHNISLVPRFTIVTNSQVHNVILSGNYQILNDNIEKYRSFTENSLLSFNLNYSLTMIQSNLTINSGINYLEFSSPLLSTNQRGINIGVNKKLLKKKLNIGFNANYSKIKSNEIHNDLISIMARVSYVLFKRSSINAQIYFLNNKSITNPIEETRGNINYRFRF